VSQLSQASSYLRVELVGNWWGTAVDPLSSPSVKPMTRFSESAVSAAILDDNDQTRTSWHAPSRSMVAGFRLSLSQCRRVLTQQLTAAHSSSQQLTAAHTSSHQLTPAHTSSHQLTPAHTGSHPLTPAHTSSHPLTPAHTNSHGVIYSDSSNTATPETLNHREARR